MSEKTMSTAHGEVIQVNDQLRADLVLAFVRRRAARAEMGEANERVERVVEKLDKDGELRKAIDRSGQFTKSYQLAESQLAAVVQAVQKEAGVNLNDYVINPDEGTLVKRPAVPEAKPVSQVIKLPVKSKKRQR